MGNAPFVLFLLLSASTLCWTNSPPDDEQVSTTVSVSLVAQKISTTSVTRIHRGENSTEQATPPADTVPISISEISVIEKPSVVSVGDNVGKFQKIKKKILASNFRNGSERFVLPSDDKSEKPTMLHAVINITEGYAKLKEGNVESFMVKSEKTTEVSEIQMNKTMIGDSKRKKDGGAVGGRSLETGSQQQNTTANFRKKTRVLPDVTELSTIGYGFGEPQKLVPTSHRKEGYSRPDLKVIRSSSTMTMPSRKSTPVSTDNTLKNAIRFESTGQTDWMPMVRERLPMRPLSTMPHEFTKLKPITSERMNKTFDRQSIVFPAANKFKKESNVIPVHNIEITRTTERHKNIVEKPSQDPSKQPIRFRGAVKYKPNSFNGTLGNTRKYHEEAGFNKSPMTENSEMEIPATGASWTLATLKGPISMKPTDGTFVTNVFNATNQTLKSEDGLDGGLVVPPESIKIENITKETNVMMTTSKSTMSEVMPSALNALSTKQSTSTPLKLVETWTSMKIKKDEQTANETEVDIPGSVDMNLSHDSTPFLEIMKMSTPEVETTSIDIMTTENTVATESPQVLITVPKTFKAATENADLLKITSQNHSDGNMEDLSDNISSDMGPVEMESTTSALPSTTDSVTLSTILKSSYSEEFEGEEGEMFTEVEPKTFVHGDTKNSSNSDIEALGRTQDHFVAVNATGSPDSMSAFDSMTKEDLALIPTTYTSLEITTLSPDTEETTPVIIKTTNEKAFDFGTNRTQAENVTLPSLTVTSARTATSVPLREVTTEGLLTPFVQTTNPTKKAMTMPITTTFTTPRIPPTPSYNDSLPIPLTTAGPRVKELSPMNPPTTTTSYKLIGRPETTEESIYYKNYIPTTVSFRDEITEENVPAYLRLTVQTTSWMELCSLREPLREAIIKVLGGENVTSEAVHFLNLSDRNCKEKIEETKEIKPNGTIFLPVNMFLMDHNRDFDKNLSEAFLTIWGRQGLDFDLPIRKVDFVTPIVNLTELYEPPLGGSVVAAIVISCVAGICVILLGILFVIMKRRQKRFNYGQRCTPVSLDAYSLDSVSIYNSVRRKGIRASKRSYGNAAFDDSEVPSHPMNFAGLANFSSGKEQLYEEFNIIPQVYPKVEELPEKAETKNRYANVIPIPETRVHLKVIDGDPLSDYINANYVRGNKGAEKLYIACQAPMESTIKDFWRMIWEQQCKVILMLTDLQENGIEKCADYLPPNEVTDNLRLFGDYQVTLKKRDVKDKYIISNLILKNMETNLWRKVTHLWYLGWPEQGVPSEANSLIAFLIEARSQMKTQNGATTTPPAVIHCSPGTGRTGTVIACDLCIREYEQNRMVDIPKCVFNIRRDRAGAVQTKDQYAFIYQVLNVYATKLSGGGIESI